MRQGQRRRSPTQTSFKELNFIAAGRILRRQSKALQGFHGKPWLRVGQQLMKVRVTRNSDCLRHAQLTVSAWKPACLLAVTMEYRERIMRASVGNGKKWFDQRAHRSLTL